MVETWWPSNDNEWTTWHDIFDGRGGSDDIQSFLDSYPLVMIKSCFPSANMSGPGSDEDSLNPGVKSTANYKWHWRSLISVMRSRPQTFFVIWTNAPQVAGSTDAAEAALSDVFCRWAKDTLAVGLDPTFGDFPPNVFVFDFFHLLAGADGMLPIDYASGSSDSHPNAAATALVAPQLVTQVFDAALAYENLTAILEDESPIPLAIQLLQNYPNPFNPSTAVSYQLPAPSGAEGSAVSLVKLSVFDALGRELAKLVDEEKPAGSYIAVWNASGMASGTYFCRLQVLPLSNPQAIPVVQTRKMLLLR
jgi:hypothetical protein